MTVYAWPSGVPVKCYGVVPSYEDNRIKTESESGLVIAYCRNTFTAKIWSVSFHWTEAQFREFDRWYRETLGAGAGWFSFPSLECDGTTAVYMFDEEPSPSGTQGYRDVSCKFREVPA